jgi:hypothetical protein
MTHGEEADGKVNQAALHTEKEKEKGHHKKPL